MSTISKLPFELIKLSKELKLASLPCSGWPPATTLISSSQIDSNQLSSMTNIQSSSSTTLFINEIQPHRKISTWNNGQSYFEKLRSVAQDRRNNQIKPCLTTTSISTSPGNQLDDALENLIGSIQPCSTWDSDDIKNNESQTDMLLFQLELLKQISINNRMNKSIQKKEFEENSQQQRFDRYTFPIITSDGNILFDFSKQFIDYDIFIQLMQLVRLSNLDKIIEKIFHKSGEYHHVDYKEKRRNELAKDQENHENVSNYFIYEFYQAPTVNRLNSHSSIDIVNSSRKLHEIDQTNCYITMAKAVHFRASSHCFILDGIDISSRFQHDRNILRDTCLRFHSYIDINSNTKQKENNDFQSDYTARSTMLTLSTNTNETIQFILVFCTDRMKQIYLLLESLLKSYISPHISIIYITFDQIKPFLTKYEQISHEILQKDTPASFVFENVHKTFPSTMPIENNLLNQSMILFQPVELKKELNTHTIVNDENITTSISEKNLLNLSSKTDDTTNKIDLSNEEVLLDYLRTSSLVLIFMKDLDETYLTAFIRWYTKVLFMSDLPSRSSWNKVLEHFWLITSDYQRAERVFDIPKTNLFLWPTEHHDFDPISIIISSILILPIVLSINYEIYSMFIDGMSIVDKHCQETTFDRNICIQMALLRIWSNICERKTIAIITCDNYLQSFGEYAQILFTEFDHIYQHKMIDTYASIHGIPLAELFLQQQNHIAYDLITISGVSKKLLQENEASHPHTLILLDRLTPLTLGVLIGVYQLSIFFENIIRDQQNILIDLNQLHSDK